MNRLGNGARVSDPQQSIGVINPSAAVLENRPPEVGARAERDAGCESVGALRSARL